MMKLCNRFRGFALAVLGAVALGAAPIAAAQEEEFFGEEAADAAPDEAWPEDAAASEDDSAYLDADDGYEGDEFFDDLDAFYVVEEPQEEGPDEVEPGIGGSEGTAGLSPDEIAAGLREPPDLPVVAKPPPTAATQPPPAAALGMVPRSSGGFAVSISVAPYQAQIFAPFAAEKWPAAYRKDKKLWELQHYCGGSLIAQEWVLTAAHCIDDKMRLSGYRIRLGSEDISSSQGATFKITAVKPHPGYTSMYANDIALVRIASDDGRPPGFPRSVSTIPIDRSGVGAKAGVAGFGWGKTKDVPGEQPSAVLMQVDLAVLDQADCAAKPGYGNDKVHANVFCASAPGRQTCRGDSGGPVVRGGTLAGVVSWGKKRCSGDGQPGVYTRVANYTGWIDDVMAGRQ